VLSISNLILRFLDSDSLFFAVYGENFHILFCIVDQVAQSVSRLATGCTGDRIPVGARFSAPVQTGPGAHPASCTTGAGSLPGVKSGRDVTLTPHPLLVPWSWKSRAISVLPLWAVRPVQALSACTRVHFSFTFTYFVNVFRGEILKMFHVLKVKCHIKFQESILISAVWLPCHYFTRLEYWGERVKNTRNLKWRIGNACFSAPVWDDYKWRAFEDFE
jgi:hypothetical protein